MNERDIATIPQVRPLIYAALSRLCGFDTSRLCDIEVHGQTLNMIVYENVTDTWRANLDLALERLGANSRREGILRVYTLPMARLLED